MILRECSCLFSSLYNSIYIHKYELHFFHSVKKKKISNVITTRTIVFRLHHHELVCQGWFPKVSHILCRYKTVLNYENLLQI
jgi:hypothetical protein